MNKPFEFNQGRPLSIERSGVTVTKIGVHLGAEVSGVDLRRPLPDDHHLSRSGHFVRKLNELWPSF